MECTFFRGADENICGPSGVLGEFLTKQASAVEYQRSSVKNVGKTIENRGNAVDFDLSAVGKCHSAVEVEHSAVEFDLKTMDFDDVAVASAVSSVETGRSAVEENLSAVGGGSMAVQSEGVAACREAEMGWNNSAAVTWLERVLLEEVVHGEEVLLVLDDFADFFDGLGFHRRSGIAEAVPHVG